MITYGRQFSIRRLIGMMRHGHTFHGLSTGETSLMPLTPPAQKLKMHSYPVAWTEAALRNKIMRAKANMQEGRDGHVMTRQY